MAKPNPRYGNGAARRKLRERFRAMGCECGICRGLRGPIRYDEPSDSLHPYSFVLDEIHPVKWWQRYGYASQTAAAIDVDNLQAAHWVCNAEKGAKDNWHVGDGDRASQRLSAPLRTSRKR